MLAMVAGLIVLGQPSSGNEGAGRFELGERLKALDSAWLATSDRNRRSQATPKITRAVTAFFSGRLSGAAMALDEAKATLLGREVMTADAVTARFLPPIAEPGGRARLVLSWAYEPPNSGPVRVRVGRQSVTLAPGRTVTIEVRAQDTAPELALTPEIGYAVPLDVGGTARTAYLSILKNARGRIKALTKSESSHVKTLADELEMFLERPRSAEMDIPVIQWLFMAEAMENRREPLTEVSEIPRIRQGATILRAAIPKALLGTPVGSTKATVVVALHGAGGSENLFFEGYGRGAAVTEALKRGWVFLSPRVSRTAVEDSLVWLQRVRGIGVERLFILGHSMGGATALQSGSVSPKPAALGLFAPAGAAVPENLREVPIYVAVGKQEIPMLRANVERLGEQLGQGSVNQIETFDPCEHLMIVADAVPSAYRFFDRHVRPSARGIGRGR
jgi:predicted esterase